MGVVAFGLTAEAASGRHSALYAVAFVLLLIAVARGVVEVRRLGPAPFVPRRTRRTPATPA